MILVLHILCSTFLKVISESLMLIEKRHHVIHCVKGSIQLFSACLYRAVIHRIPNLRCRYGIHHLIQHDIRDIQNTRFLVVCVGYLLIALCFMIFLMLLLQIRDKALQLFDVGTDSFHPFFFILYLIQIKRWNPCA